MPAGPREIAPGQAITYAVSVRNDSEYALSGTQVRLHMPHDLAFAGTAGDVVTVQGDEIVFTLGYLAVGAQQTVQIPMSVPSNVRPHKVLRLRAHLYSSTALPLETNAVSTTVR